MQVQTKLNQIREGMEVYDNSGKRIGHVNAVRYGEGGLDAKLPDILTMREAVNHWLGSATTLPTPMYADIYRDGFIRIKRGFFRSDVIALPAHIDDIGADMMYINIPLADLSPC